MSIAEHTPENGHGHNGPFSLYKGWNLQLVPTGPSQRLLLLDPHRVDRRRLGKNRLMTGPEEAYLVYVTLLSPPDEIQRASGMTIELIQQLPDVLINRLNPEEERQRQIIELLQTYQTIYSEIT